MGDDRDEHGNLRVTDVSFGLAVKQAGRDIELMSVSGDHLAWLNEECLRRIVAYARRMGYSIPDAGNAPSDRRPREGGEKRPIPSESIGYSLTAADEGDDVSVGVGGDHSGRLYFDEETFQNFVRFCRRVGWADAREAVVSFAVKTIGSGVEAESFGPSGPLRIGLHGSAERTLFLDLESVQALVDFAVDVGYASTGKQPTGRASGDPFEGEDLGYGVTALSAPCDKDDIRLTTDNGPIWLNEAAFKKLVRFARKVKGWKTL